MSRITMTIILLGISAVKWNWFNNLERFSAGAFGYVAQGLLKEDLNDRQTKQTQIALKSLKSKQNPELYL